MMTLSRSGSSSLAVGIVYGSRYDAVKAQPNGTMLVATTLVG